MRRSATRDSALTDAELLRRFLAVRDEAAFEVLVWRHSPAVLGVCRRVLRGGPETEDAFQATFLALVREAKTVGRRGAVGGWLYRVAWRAALRAKAARRARDGRPVPEPAAAPADHDPLAREARAVIGEEVGRLPARYREPVVLCYLQGKTNEEAAREIGCPKGTVLSRLAWARERLRLRLTRRGVTLAGGALAASAVPEASAAVCAALIDSTIKTAAASAAGPAAAGAIPASVAALTEGVLRNMFLSKLKTAVAILLAIAVVGTAGALWHPAHAAPNDATPQQAGEVSDEDRAAVAGFERGT